MIARCLTDPLTSPCSSHTCNSRVVACYQRNTSLGKPTTRGGCIPTFRLIAFASQQPTSSPHPHHMILTTNRRGDEIVRHDVEGPHTLVQSMYLLLYRLQCYEYSAALSSYFVYTWTNHPDFGFGCGYDTVSHHRVTDEHPEKSGLHRMWWQSQIGVVISHNTPHRKQIS